MRGFIPFSLIALTAYSGAYAEPPQRDPFMVPYEAAHAAALTGKSALNNVLELRGVLSAGMNSLANVSGEILAIGESIDGYVLVGVNEDGAIFERAGTRYTVLLVDPGPANTEVEEDAS